MSDYKRVQESLASGVDPALLCSTCPWDRYCIVPPEMTAEDVKRQIDDAIAKDKEQAEEAKAEGKSPGMPIGGIVMALTLGGRDQQAKCCPVLAVRLRSSAGRGLVDSLKATMQGWDDDEVPA